MEKNSHKQITPPEWVRWLAQDADGTWWGFEAEPHQADKSWYENEVGRYVRLEVGEPNDQWRESLSRYGSKV